LGKNPADFFNFPHKFMSLTNIPTIVSDYSRSVIYASLPTRDTLEDACENISKGFFKNSKEISSILLATNA
jgi:hypothetical protein